MWTTSSFRAKCARHAVVGHTVALALMLAGCIAAPVAPDAPRPMRDAPSSQLIHEDSSAYVGTVELTGVRVSKLDAVMQRMAGPAFLAKAREPLAIDVQTARPLPATPRTTSAVLLLNGERLDNTWAILPNRLVAFLPDRSKLKDTNSVTAAWIGSESSSRSRKPLTFRAADVGRQLPD